jgi:hypothetical protein
MAKEESLDCLCCLFKNKKYQEKVKMFLWRLFKDKEYTIRRTSFDKIHRLYNIDKSFSMEIVDYIIENDEDKILLRRANRFKSEYENK